MRIKDFGSDFNWIDFNKFNNSFNFFPRDAIYYGSGRSALVSIVCKNYINNRWKRIFIPEYYCHTVTDEIKKIGIKIEFYKDFPGNDDINTIINLNFNVDDVLLRVNYFGLRSYRDNQGLKVSVIEDHSHGFLSDWAKNSNAEWCFASLRKEFPIPDGGIAWSPIRKIRETSGAITENHSEIVNNRYLAMKLKSLYLQGKIKDKFEYRKLFVESEALIGNSYISGISEISFNQLMKIPYTDFYKKKLVNYHLLYNYLELYKDYIFNKLEYLEQNTIPFSFILKFDNEYQRNLVKNWLINNGIYPAILWPQCHDSSKEVLNFFETMLSIHIDFRYNATDIKYIADQLILKVKNL